MNSIGQIPNTIIARNTYTDTEEWLMSAGALANMPIIISSRDIPVLLLASPHTTQQIVQISLSALQGKSEDIK